MNNLVRLYIDDQCLLVEEGISVLEAALTNNIYIPHLCHHPDLQEITSCRLCLVEFCSSGEIVPSCSLKAHEGLAVKTNTEMVIQLRNLAMELLLAAHPEDCTTCPEYGKCEFQTLIQFFGVSAGRLFKRSKAFDQIEDHLIIHDMNRCVLCARCVRACDQLRGVDVLRFLKRDNVESYVGTLHQKLLRDSGCRFCGACVEVCPTGAIRDMIHWSPAEKRETLLPCQAVCPAHVNVPEYTRCVADGQYSEAAAVIREQVPLPYTLGYICVHNCEIECRLASISAPVSIRNIKRFAASQDDERWKQRLYSVEKRDKRIAVLGSGPAGLTAAYYAGRLGYQVTLYEKATKLGGQLRYGIPKYRLPRDVIDREIKDIIEIGKVEVRNNSFIKNINDLFEEGFDAVFLACGAHEGIRLPIPGSRLAGVTDSVEFLAAFERDAASVGGTVVILGGGNVAMDCAGVAIRLGAKEVSIVCLEAYADMTASQAERQWAEEEGVKLYNGKSFLEIGEENGFCTGVLIKDICNLRKENGHLKFDLLEDTDVYLEADTVIFAVGQRPVIPDEFGLALIGGAYVYTEENSGGQTSLPGVWAAGDCVTGTQSVIQAIAGAKAAIKEMDLYLGGDGDIEECLSESQLRDPKIGRIPEFGYLERLEPDVVPVPERIVNWKTCGVMDLGLSEEKAVCEAKRCLQCDLRFDIQPHRIWSDYSSKQGKTEDAV